MKEIHWKEEYPKMPEYMEKQLVQRISRELEQTETKTDRQESQKKVRMKNHYQQIAGAIICCVIVLSTAGVVTASMEDGSLHHLTSILFQEGKEIADLSVGNVVDSTTEENEDKVENTQKKVKDKEVPEQFELDIEKYGTVLTDSYQGDGYTVNLMGLITDGYTGLLFYEIHMDNTPRGNDEWWGVSQCFSETGILLSQSADTLLNKDGSSYNYEEFGGSDISLYGTTITFTMDSIINSSASERYDCDLEMQIPINERSGTAERNLKVMEDADFGFYGEGYIEDITVTPLGIYLNCSSYQGKENKGAYTDAAKVAFKDGTELTLLSMGFNEKTHQGHINFGYPVDPDQVVSFQLGDYSYTLE